MSKRIIILLIMILFTAGCQNGKRAKEESETLQESTKRKRNK